MAGRKREPKSAYDQFKEYEGKRYTGMKVGRRHKWRYDEGEWSEKKVTPDKWEFQYAVKKHRAGRAPEGSGAPVGTAYNWYILAHQIVTKLDANTYSTEMAGLKFKVAHKRADKDTWSASEQRQRKIIADLLRKMLADLETSPPESAPKVTGQKSVAATKKRATPKTRATTATKRPRATRRKPTKRALRGRTTKRAA